MLLGYAKNLNSNSIDFGRAGASSHSVHEALTCAVENDLAHCQPVAQIHLYR